MKLKHFTYSFAYLSLLLPLLGGLSVPAAAQVGGHTLFVREHTRIAEVHHADGSISSAEFAAELILHPDGRANGGWGLRELGTADVLTLYRVVEGRASSDHQGPFFEFKSQRLSPLPGDGITIILHPLANPHLPTVSTGSVTFRVDVSDPLAGGTLSFVAPGQVLPHPDIPSVTEVFDRSSFINAPPQTVVVQTPRGSYTAYFMNVALVFPSGGVFGLLELAAPSGEVVRYHHHGPGVYRSIDGGATWALHARAGSTGDEITIINRSAPDASEPCRIYDILGTQVNAPLRFEAHADITIF